MKKAFTFSSFLLMILTVISYQASSQVINKCGSDQIHNQLMQTDPVYAQKMLTYETYVQSVQNSAQRTMGTVYKIPVVVHVMHKGEAVGTGINVSDAAIQNAIQDLNEMYRKIPGTQGDGNGVDVEIEYALAVRDPSGNCTNGIVRVNMTGNAAYMSNGVNRQATGGISDATLKSISVWDQTKYYNIWLISEIDNNNGGSGIQGYAYFASSHGTSVDGAVILSSNFTSGTSTTAAHEIGHSLNLYHTFEGDNNGASCPATNGCGSGVGDCCGDIPQHIRSASDCVTGTNSCTGTSRDLFIHNYMDYSSDACQNMLTANQKTRMVTALTTTRASFIGPGEGGTNMSLVPVASAGVDFSASGSILCGTGQSITFLDKSTCIPNSYIPLSSFSGITHLWTITNGVNTYTSSSQNPTITFTNSGTFDVTLQVTNSFGTTSLTKPGMIVVATAPGTPCTPTTQNAANYAQTINNVKLNGINYSSSTLYNDGYTDLACSYNTTVTAGSTYNLSISARAGGSGAEVFEVYINYNNDADFADAGELIFSGSNPANTSGTYTTNITIPATAVQNTLLRMRVIGETGTINATERNCGVGYFIGDVEDYGVYIKSNGCTTPTINLTPTTATICSGQSTTLTVSGATSYTWLPSGSGSSSVVTPTSTTIYTVTGSTGTCVSTPKTATVNVTTTPVVTLTPATATICSGQTTTLTASGATTYSWLPTGSGTSSAVSPTATTVYTLTGTTGGCVSAPKTSTVTVNATPVVTLSPTSTTICAGQSATITASGATTYTWLPSGSGSSSVVSPTITTTYTVTGSNSACVSAPKTTTVIVNAIPVVTLTPTASTICAGQSTTLTASGASTYTWLPSGSGSSSVVSPTTTTTYTVRGSNGSCISAPRTTTVTVNAIPVVTLTPTASTICAGQSTTITASGASTYTWLPSGSGSSSVVSPTITTTYTVTGSNGTCVSAPKTTTVTVNAIPVVTLIPTASTICAGQSTTITASGASTYTWLPSGSGSSSVVSPPITSTYTVTGSNGACVSTPKTTTVTVNAVPVVTLTPTASTICAGQSTTITASGASTYTWLPSGSGTSCVVTPTATTTYTVRGSNGTCVSAPKTSVVTVNSVPVITLSPNSATICSGQSAIITASGATTYSWNTGVTTASVSVSPTTTTVYTVTGSASGCSAIRTGTVAVTTSPTLTVNSATICSGSNVVLTVSGASTYSWSTGATTPTISVAPTITSFYTVTGSNGSCSGIPKTSTVTVNSNPATTASTSGTLTCANFTVGLNSTLAGMNYTWTAPGGASVANANVQNTTGNGPGIYTLTVFNPSSGCSFSTTTSVTQNTTAPTVSGSVTGVLTCVSNTVNVRATTGASPVSYAWTGPGIISGSTTGTVTVNQPGTYNYTVTNTSNGCKTSGSQSVIQNTTPPTVSVSASQTITCASPTVTLTGSANPSNSIPVWTGGVASGANSYTATAASPNTYTLTVTNPTNGCMNSATTQVFASAGVPSVATSVTNSLTCSTLTAQVVATTTSTPVTYNWSGPGIVSGATNSSAIVNAAGVYTVVVTNTSSGCASTVTASVAQNTVAPSVSGSTSGTLTCSTLTVTTRATTTSSPVSYSWTGSGIVSGASTGTIVVNQPGTYNYTVTNTANGCKTIGTRSVTQNTIVPTSTLSPINSTICAGNSQTLSVMTSTANSIMWSTGSSASSITVSPASNSTYTVTVTNSVNGCSSSSIANVTVNSGPTVTVNNPAMCSGASTVLTASGATSYSWNTGATTPTISVAPTVTSFYTVTGSNGSCSGTPKTVTVTVNATPVVTLTPVSSTICSGQNVVLNTSGANSYTWMPSGSGTTNTVSPTSTTVYTVIGSTGSCIGAAKTATVNVTTIPTISVTPTSTTICSGQSTLLNASGAATYTWLPSGSGSANNVSPSGTTVYTVTGSNGSCVGVAKTATVNVNASPVIIASTDNTLICTGYSSTLTVTGGISYTWSPSSSLSASTGSVVAASPTVTTTYTVVGSDGLCDGTATVVQNVSLCTGINNLVSSNEVIVYPNPSNGVFTITYASLVKKLNVEVLNSIGQTVMVQSIENENQLIIDLTKMAKGIYYLKASSENGNKLFKLILE